jgi:hypothetical protein
MGAKPQQLLKKLLQDQRPIYTTAVGLAIKEIEG